MNLTTCSSDVQCPRNLVCYVNVSWSPITGAFCDCETPFYGWIGPNCDEFGPTTSFIFTFALFTFILTLPLLLLGILAIVDMVDYKELQRWTPVVQTFLLTLAAFTAELLYSLSLMLERTHPFGFNAFVNGERFHDYAEMGQFAILLVVVSYTFCVESVALVWIEVAMRVEKVSTKAVLKRSTYFIRGLQLYGVIVSIVMFATTNYSLGQTLLMPLVVFGIVLYPYGRYRFLKVISTLSNDPTSAQTGKKLQDQMIPLINRTYAIIMVSLFGILITFIVSAAIFPARREISPKGALSPIMANLFFVNFFGWLGILGIYLYVTVLLYKTRVQVVGYPPYHRQIEAIIFAGFSQFRPEERSQTNPRFSKEFSSREAPDGRKESYDRFRGASEGLGQVRKTSVEGFNRLKVATTKKIQEFSAKMKKPKEPTTQNQSSLTSVDSASSEV